MVEREEVSDVQREHVVESLAERTVAGELTDDERTARTRQALEASSPDELDEATRGLSATVRPPLLARAADRLPLRIHVAAFLAVSAAMLVVWALTRDTDMDASDESAGLFWPFWVMLAWGVLLTAHALYSLRRPAFQRRRRPPRRRYPS